MSGGPPSKPWPGDSIEPLSAAEAFDVMRVFLENWWKRSGSPQHSVFEEGDVLWLLSACDRGVWADGGPMDPAMWSDWQDAVSQVRAGDVPMATLSAKPSA